MDNNFTPHGSYMVFNISKYKKLSKLHKWKITNHYGTQKKKWDIATELNVRILAE